MALLQLERISAQYPGAAEPVLSDISLSLGPQQLLVALGPSGSGKTSLLNLIAGFVEPSAGRITLDGVPFQDDALLPWQNVLANVGFVPGKCSRWSIWRISISVVSGNCPAVRNNASAWPAPWRRTRGCC